MNNLFNKIESIILTLSIISLITLVCIQFINIKDENVMSTVGYNSELRFLPLNEKQFDKGIVVVSLVDKQYKQTEILVNGESIDDFSGSDELQIQVYDNDLIEIDGTKYTNNVKVKVIGVSSNIEYPKLDTIISTSQSIEILGKVRLK
ncbi:hypothetical protein [Sporanaerobacter acetigenes]|uniref:Uncharacterized protein n=1 Tax=Sporanaerobacter acetigenes DSM 13106 TaxID=1123281 RepID=A0A1M5XMQ1_9FIRM|nr:hypothetical protein [Sporanaerobacter acetigenes]SHI00814.1 hypothetical protein SAMN02745180_01742 [Sporanaerobacter acetigenes DSM 13106]